MARANPALVGMWEQRIKEWEGSGKSASQWCKEKELRICQFYYWRDRRLAIRQKRRLKRLETLPLFTELKDERAESISDSGIAISFQGFRLELSSEFDQETLLKCLTTLKSI